ncbi:MAG: recombinase family protein [Alphaproteobacteria bacterium]|nr:recombinase family protein [Alphaproteobacteria bacterium]MCB9985550.1 recombinase family protein [Micavibrio sp.]HPQ50778.1 recombinase family protein [Alphaproteobacteria bacterium]
MWQGGRAPFGFDIGDRRLITNEEDAPVVRQVFELYLNIGCARKLADELKLLGIKSRERISQRGLKYGGEYFSRGALHSLLTNPVYIGKIRHIDKVHEGIHDAIIPQELWDAVQDKLQGRARQAVNGERKNSSIGIC